MKLSDPYNISDLRARANLVTVLFATLLGLLVIRAWYLQIWEGDVYRDFSDRNRFKTERLSASRGQILDRNGVLLADSRPRFDLNFIRGNSQDIESELKILKDVFVWSDEEYQKKLKRISETHPFLPFILAHDITRDQLALVQSQIILLPSVDVDVQAVRDYLYKDAFFHVIGYTGDIGEQELERLRLRYPERAYRLGDQKGVIGIESVFEGRLRGRDGRDFVVVDVKGRRVNEDQWHLLPKIERIEPTAGEVLQLGLDVELQMTAFEALGKQSGAAVAIDTKTGQVLAYVSKPALDPNLFSEVLSAGELKHATESADRPFLDRVVAEHYPPGSTFKIIMATAALESGLITKNTSFYCPGHFRLGNRVWKCWEKTGHGSVNIEQAIERSCDVFFYNVALQLGLDTMFSWSSKFGLGRRTFVGAEVYPSRNDKLIRFNTEQTGFIPNVDWVQSKRLSSVEAETINAGIGQGAYTVTAMQLARVIAAIGNGGKIYQPQLVLSSENTNGMNRHTYQAQLETQLHFTPEFRDLVLKGMENVINGSLGTARLSKIAGIRFGGKTGTAQVAALELSKTRDKKFQDHALFVGLAPLDDPQIAVAVIVENGGHGSSAAAPVAKAMVKNYLERKIARPDQAQKPIQEAVVQTEKNPKADKDENDGKETRN